MADELLWGVKNGDLDAVKKSCEKVTINEIDLKCDVVLQPGFDVNAELLSGRNPLHYAADYGQVDVIDYLLTKGAKIDVSGASYDITILLQLPDKHGITALLAAIFEGHTECVRLLISKVICPFITKINEIFMFLIRELIRRGSLQMVYPTEIVLKMIKLRSC